jgi:hypothetical protein
MLYCFWKKGMRLMEAILGFEQYFPTTERLDDGKEGA